jgi:hypothetical protein
MMSIAYRDIAGNWHINEWGILFLISATILLVKLAFFTRWVI